MSHLEEWLLPGSTLLTLVVWILVLWSSLPALRGKKPGIRESRIAMLVGLLGISASLCWSSLVYPRLITADDARNVLIVGRTVLLVSGVWALIAQRYRE